MGKQSRDAGSVACLARERPRTQYCAAQRASYGVEISVAL